MEFKNCTNEQEVLWSSSLIIEIKNLKFNELLKFGLLKIKKITIFENSKTYRLLKFNSNKNLSWFQHVSIPTKILFSAK